MPHRARIALALAGSLAVHTSLLAPWGTITPPPPPRPIEARILVPPIPEKQDLPQTRQSRQRHAELASPPAPERVEPPASLEAPAAPSAEEWRLASSYTPRNSKRYRNAWGQQVRSMMGTAAAGPDQGLVRFRIEIAPDGKVAHVEELWSTSAKASMLAWRAIRALPPLPPTPTGKPLVFEQTLSFLPYETGWPPSYQLDCLPEPESFRNPFSWDGVSPPSVTTPTHRPPPPEGCPPDSTEATIEAEERSMKRQLDQWRWAR